MSPIALWTTAAAALLAALGASSMSEDHRMEEYRKRGYKWPLDAVVPDTPGWRRIMDRRFEQVSRVQNNNDKYNGWLGFMASAVVVANYTENGWGLTRAPEHIHRRLLDRLYRTLEVARVETREECSDRDTDGEGGGECVPVEQEILEPRGDGTRKEHFVNVIEAKDHARPIMIRNHRENEEILEEMRPMFERWSGVDLKGSTAYGIRAYRNDSNLLMHVDKSTTHVISGIFHVDRSDDAEPWPIVIEDFQGNTNQVYLEPGDVLFYESSKCWHGRPHTFIGSYYANLFMHYRPVDFEGGKVQDELHYAVPEHWHRLPPPKEGLDEMVVVGTSFKEPACENLLCSLDKMHEQSNYLVDWYGPALRGTVATTGWDPEQMTPPREMT